jgi:hypothetical protein
MGQWRNPVEDYAEGVAQGNGGVIQFLTWIFSCIFIAEPPMGRFFTLGRAPATDISLNGTDLGIGITLSTNMATPLRSYNMGCKNGGLLN